MEVAVTKPKKKIKLGIGLVIFPLFLLTLLYLFLGFPFYYSFTSSSSSPSSSSPSSSSSLYNHFLKSSSSSSAAASSSSSSSSSVVSNPPYPPSNSSSISTYNHTNNSSLHHDGINNPNSNQSSLRSHDSIPSSSSNDHHSPHQETSREKHAGRRRRDCDISSGEWVPNHEAPYYTNTTCWAIHEHQNCMKFGRPDSGFMKWRWKPYGCDLPLFDPLEFLEIMRGKSMAFIGDSVSRNHMQSLICLLSRVEYPEDVSLVQDFNFPRWKYKSFNFTIASFWSTHLVRSTETGPTGQYMTNYYNLHLDEPDPIWASQIGGFDYVIVSSGQWFFRPLFFFDKGKLVGCLYCYMPGVRNVGAFFAFRRAFRTTFRAILGAKHFKGEVFLRTFAPSHFENGEWNKGGNCLRTHPDRSNETELKGMNLEAHEIQLEEFRIARREGRRKGVRFRLVDVTKAMLLRGDGHPSRYGHRPEDNVILYNDCVHWCLPGPIDSWNDFLLHTLKNQQ
ncbi:PREDICTED: protein trichome birefringence-like 20 [Tarenaya hassleriana]|uniref:Uncharacterized protein n=1 Tax=Tarenaya spinosa TaxID=228870 RepID=Q1KUN5_9ROSI|nr:PREDICTED: protein trichome birefringence-like 20 [Tarenaya hassleriana]ABD96951.1 hypothetical protein [Tarenaya spinosa]